MFHDMSRTYCTIYFLTLTLLLCPLGQQEAAAQLGGDLERVAKKLGTYNRGEEKHGADSAYEFSTDVGYVSIGFKNGKAVYVEPTSDGNSLAETMGLLNRVTSLDDDESFQTIRWESSPMQRVNPPVYVNYKKTTFVPTGIVGADYKVRLLINPETNTVVDSQPFAMPIYGGYSFETREFLAKSRFIMRSKNGLYATFDTSVGTDGRTSCSNVLACTSTLFFENERSRFAAAIERQKTALLKVSTGKSWHDACCSGFVMTYDEMLAIMAGPKTMAELIVARNKIICECILDEPTADLALVQEVVSKWGRKEVQRHLIAILNNRPLVRLHRAKLFGEFGDKNTITALIGLTKRDESKDVALASLKKVLSRTHGTEALPANLELRSLQRWWRKNKSKCRDIKQ